MKIVAGILAVSFALAGTFPSGICAERVPVKSYEIESKVFDLCNRSTPLMNSRNYPQAIVLLQQAAKFDRTSYSDYVHEKLSECYSESNQFDMAIKEAETALKYDPNSGAAHYYLAQLYYRNEHFDTATQYLNKLLQITTDKQWANSARDLLREIETYGKVRAALSAMKSKHYAQARKLFEDAARFDPSAVSKITHHNLAYISREMGKPETAIVEAKKALQYDQNDANLMYMIAISLQDIGEYDDAIQWLKRCLQVEGDAERRKNVTQMISELTADRSKLNSAANKAPDYLETMVGGGGIQRWSQDKLPIKVFIKSGTGVKGFRSEYPSFVNHALDTWCAASGRKLAYKIVKDEKSADIVVAWVDEPITMVDDGKKRVKQGLATNETSEGIIESVLVQVDTMNSLRPAEIVEPGECATVCLHEIGHSLGVMHSTACPDLMFFGRSSKQTGDLTSRDKATIARLYKNYPVCTLAPVEQKPPPVKFEPPPSFLPPLPGDEKELTPPTFLPPPIDDNEEKLTPPPFFQPPPISVPGTNATPKKAPGDPLPPTFMPPPIESSAGKSSKDSVKPASSKQAPKKK